MAKKKRFIFREEWVEALVDLNNELRLEVLGAISIYCITGEMPEISEVGLMAFKVIKPQIDKSLELSEARREAGHNGGAPKGNSNASKNNQKQPKTTKR